MKDAKLKQLITCSQEVAMKANVIEAIGLAVMLVAIVLLVESGLLAGILG
jgi:hypothetical protein